MTPSYETMQKMLRAFPEVSGDFLLGKGGEVLRSEKQPSLFLDTHPETAEPKYQPVF